MPEPSIDKKVPQLSDAVRPGVSKVTLRRAIAKVTLTAKPFSYLQTILTASLKSTEGVFLTQVRRLRYPTQGQ